MGYPKVKVYSRHKHVALKANLVNAGRREGNRQAHHAHQRRRGLSRVAERVLRPKTTQQQNNLKATTNIYDRTIFRVMYAIYCSRKSYSITRRLEVAPSFSQSRLHPDTEGPVKPFVGASGG